MSCARKLRTRSGLDTPVKMVAVKTLAWITFQIQVLMLEASPAPSPTTMISSSWRQFTVTWIVLTPCPQASHQQRLVQLYRDFQLRMTTRVGDNWFASRPMDAVPITKHPSEGEYGFLRMLRGQKKLPRYAVAAITASTILNRCGLQRAKWQEPQDSEGGV